MKVQRIDEMKPHWPVEVYLSASDSCHVHWPYRMAGLDECYPRYVDDADKFIVDSEFDDPDKTNIDALDKAHELNADVVVLEDVYQDFENTVDKLLEGRELVDDHPFDGEVIYPLQEPHVECWTEIGEPDTIGIGGYKDEHASEKVRISQKVRDGVGDDVWVHGLGFGPSEPIIRAVRADQDLLDSIDSQTPYLNAKSDPTWDGTFKSATYAIRSLATMVEACRRMNPELTDDPHSEHEQTGMGAWT